nr:MAG TPA: hypothetical protein [Caudoviricetes sp.]
MLFSLVNKLSITHSFFFVNTFYKKKYIFYFFRIICAFLRTMV